VVKTENGIEIAEKMSDYSFAWKILDQNDEKFSSYSSDLNELSVQELKFDESATYKICLTVEKGLEYGKLCENFYTSGDTEFGIAISPDTGNFLETDFALVMSADSDALTSEFEYEFGFVVSKKDLSGKSVTALEPFGKPQKENKREKIRFRVPRSMSMKTNEWKDMQVYGRAINMDTKAVSMVTTEIRLKKVKQDAATVKEEIKTSVVTSLADLNS
jgi:hypothetical protein